MPSVVTASDWNCIVVYSVLAAVGGGFVRHKVGTSDDVQQI